MGVLAPTRYTLIVVRRQAALLSILLACSAAFGAKPAPKRRPPPPPAASKADRTAAIQLGQAYTAFRAGDYAAARRLVPTTGLLNKDYALYVSGQAAALGGDPGAALPRFRAVAAMKGSRFQGIAAWRAADCLWDLGRGDEAR